MITKFLLGGDRLALEPQDIESGDRCSVERR
jgi:hypothetical protein